MKTFWSGLALAAGALTTCAQQTEYSTNIVGFVEMRVASGYNLLANPFSAGVTNGANEIMPAIDGEIILTWNGMGYNYVSYDTGFGGWIDANFDPASPPWLPPGKGFFFFNPGAATTVTFAGQVRPGPCQTNWLSLPPGYSLLGSVLPASVTDISAGPVRLPLIDGMFLLRWNGWGWDYRAYDSAFGGWIDPDFNPMPPPGYSIGTGFFLFQPLGLAAWPQWLPCP